MNYRNNVGGGVEVWYTTILTKWLDPLVHMFISVNWPVDGTEKQGPEGGSTCQSNSHLQKQNHLRNTVWFHLAYTAEQRERFCVLITKISWSSVATAVKTKLPPLTSQTDAKKVTFCDIADSLPGAAWVLRGTLDLE